MPRSRFLCLFATVVALGFLTRAAAEVAVPAAPQVAPSGVRVWKGLTFATPPGAELKLDLYLPPTTEAKSRAVPLLVWIHGGGWQEGGRGFCPISPLARNGYAVASISYRFTQQAVFPAQLEDAQAAVRWLRAHAAEYGFDPARIGVCGESAGALLASLLGTMDDEKKPAANAGADLVSIRVQAVVSLCGPSDVTLDDNEQALVPELLKSADRKEVLRGVAIRSRGTIMTAALGGPLAEHRDLARLMSPVLHVSSDDPPFFLIHGDSDDLVPMSQSQLLQAALEKAGVKVSLEVVKGAGHGFGRPKPDMMARIEKFFDEALGKNEATAAHAP